MDDQAEGPICGVVCRYGGMSSWRKHANVELGWMWHCNRPVRSEGERCWQHAPKEERP